MRTQKEIEEQLEKRRTMLKEAKNYRSYRSNYVIVYVLEWVLGLKEFKIYKHRKKK